MRIESEDGSTATQASAAQAAGARRSIRQYDETPIPHAELRELLRLASRAPSAFNVQPWRWVVVQQRALREQLSAAAYGQQQILRAPATIVLYSDMVDALARMPESMHPDLPDDRRDAGVASVRATWAGKPDAEREAWGNAQANIALGYLLLLAETMGYGTSPMLGFEPEKVRALLGLPAHVPIAALVSIGYPAEEGFRPHRLPIDSLVQFR